MLQERTSLPDLRRTHKLATGDENLARGRDGEAGDWLRADGGGWWRMVEVGEGWWRMVQA